MKKTILLIGLTSLLSVAAQAASTLTAWTFDNLSIAANSTPQASTGFGAASLVGLSSGSVQSLAGSSSGAANSWNVSGGWSTNSAIGSQGGKFSASTFGYYKIKLSFDVNATANAEANLLVQYTTDGAIWNNAAITSSGGTGYLTNNPATNSTVLGSYVQLASGWNNQIVVDLSGVSGVDNNNNFAVRIVNASTGSNCVNTTGALYANNSGTWTFDNVKVEGVSIDTVTAWTFESTGTLAFAPHPVPEFGSGTATSIGFDNNYNFSDGTVGSTNKPDVLANGVPYSSSGSSGQSAWRVRGAGSGSGHNGWHTVAPIGSQGADFAVSTVNYNDVVISFDMFSTSQGEAKMCVLYTTDNWTTTNVANNLFYPANPTFIFTNALSSPSYSPDTVTGTYFYQNTGQNFYNNFIVDFTGVAGVANNPNFAFRIANAAQNGDCVAFNGGSYNNSSGNWRYDNVTIGGTFTGSVAPTIAYDPTATVDRLFTNTFTDDAAWRAKIGSIYVNGSLLTNTAYAKNIAGQLIFNPTNSVLLQSSGVKSIVINATNYTTAKVTQPIGAGVAVKLAISSQPVAPSASGGTLVTNPVITISDKYGNGTTNPYATVSVVASVSNSVAWKLGGSTNQVAVNGVATFTNLSATVTGSTAVAGAAITFTVTGYAPLTVTNSSVFTIGAPPVAFTRGNLAVVQIDTVANNTTFSVIEIKPSAARQTTPVSITPISATGTNGLRLASTGSCGKLTLSDDGTLISFVGFQDDSSATLDETFTLNRAVGTLNYTNQFNLPFSYVSTSFGGSQGRSCASLDNYNWIADDKGGLYFGNSNAVVTAPNLNANNNIVVRTFGGIPYVETQKTVGGSPIPVVYSLDPMDPTITVGNNLVTDPIAVDFYMISTNGGSTYDILYVLDQVSATSGIIKKYSWVPDGTQVSGYGWAANGSFTNGNGGETLFTTTNGVGGAYLYYTTGGGGTAGNSVIRLTDAAGYNTPMNITSSNVIYTAAATASIKGLTFVPQQTPYLVSLTPPPILTTQTVATVSGQFAITNTPDDSTWRTAITRITVNGSVLPVAAYSTNQAGKIVFDPAQSTLLQTAGAKAIVISATGYSTNSVTQTIGIGAPAKLAVTTQPTAPVGNGGALVVQPVVTIQDVYGNAIATATSNVVAQVGAGAWTIGGTTTKAALAGAATFTGLTATSVAAVTGATITFTSTGLTSATSSTFNIPAPIQSSLTGVALTGGKLKFVFTNATGLSFSVLATNNVAAPRANWPVVGAAVESPAGSGSYQFTNSATTNSQLFYLLRQP